MVPGSRSTNRNSAGKANMVLYLLAIGMVATGMVLVRVTQINLLTGSVTNPYLAIGIVLSALGLILGFAVSRAAKARLRR